MAALLPPWRAPAQIIGNPCGQKYCLNIVLLIQRSQDVALILRHPTTTVFLIEVINPVVVKDFHEGLDPLAESFASRASSRSVSFWFCEYVNLRKT